MNMEVQSASTTSPTDQPARSRSRTTRKRKGPSISLLCEFERYNPRRSPAWRWKLAERIVAKADRSRPGRADVHLGRAVEFQRRLQRCHTPGRLKQLRDADPDLFAALELHQAGGWRRTLVEARLLAALPAAEVAQRSQMTEGAVTAYVVMFYDVVERLTGRDYILLRAIGTPRRAKSDLDYYAQSLKTVGYFMGPLALEMLAKLVFDDEGVYRTDTADLQTREGRLAIRLRLFVEVRRPGELSPSYLLEIQRTLARIQEIERREAAAATAQDTTLGERDGAKGIFRSDFDAVIALHLDAAMPKSSSVLEAGQAAENSKVQRDEKPSRIAV